MDMQKGREVVERVSGAIRKYLKEEKTVFWKIIKKIIHPVGEYMFKGNASNFELMFLL